MRVPSHSVSRRRISRPFAIEPLENRLAMAVFTVTNNNDSGAGSLREAIDNANARTGLDRIQFNIASPSKVISLQTPLPSLVDPTEVDGTTQTGFNGQPIVELDGSSITIENTSGLVVASANTLIRGLVINNFYNGIALNRATGARIMGNRIGVNAAGTEAVGNHWVGVYVIDSVDSLIGGSAVADRNIISGNGEIGVRLLGNSFNNRIQGNYLGTDVTGTKALPNKRWGVLVSNGAGQSIIGTDGDGQDDAAEGNVISANLWAGIRLSGTDDNLVAGNLIGLGAGEQTALGNGTDGILIDFLSSGNLIGTNSDGLSDDLEANVIGYNRDNGVRISNSNQNHVSGNSIGLRSDGVTAVPNMNSGVFIDSGSAGNLIGMASADSLTGVNTISGNGGHGIYILKSNANSIQGNLIGRTADDQAVLANLLAGVQISQSSNNLVGSTPQLANSFGYRFSAIVVDGPSTGNLFQCNQYVGLTSVPIDLGGDSTTFNDAGDVDSGPNNLQNHPEIKLATVDGVVAGTFNSLPFRTYALQLYTYQLAANGVDLEYRYLTSVEVNTDEQGNAAWYNDTSNPLAVDQAIAAIARDTLAGTSEFSTVKDVESSRDIVLSKSRFAENIGSITGTVFRSTVDPPGAVTIKLSTSDSTRSTVPAQVVIPAESDSVQFTIQVVDDQRYRYDQLMLFATGDNTLAGVELLVDDNDNPWNHSGKSLDVNGDGQLSAIDALLIINELNAGRSGSLNNRLLEFPPTFFDVSNDGNLTALDALLVINGINSNASASGEGGIDVDDLERITGRQRSGRR